MKLYILRHAWAEERDASQWPNDDLRPLTEKGKKKFADIAVKLIQRGVTPQVIATSPLVRCQETADIFARAMPEPPHVDLLDALRPGGNLEDLLQWTARQAKQRQYIAWVGHAPDVGQLAATLIGQPDGQIRFAKGSVAAIRFDDLPARSQGELQWLVTAKILLG